MSGGKLAVQTISSARYVGRKAKRIVEEMREKT
jgi:hypothetical protein